MSKRTIKNNLRIGLGLSLFILFVTSFASYLSIRNLIKSADMVAHSNEVMTKLDAVISTLKDAETGQRGYLLTGDKDFLAPYHGAKQQALGLLDDVGLETTDNPVQQRNVKKLREVIEGRLEILKNTVDIKSRGGSVSVTELINGKTYMDAARALIKMMQDEEKRLLELRTADMNKLAGYTPSLIVFAAFLALLITFFFYRKVSSDFNDRVRLQQELQDKNEEIDNRIEVIQAIAGRISNGDYQIRLDGEEKDGLGSLAGSLNAMAESLQYSFSLLADKEWLQSGIAVLNDKMVGEKSVAELAEDILENIVERTNSQVAAFYLVEEDSLLHLAASYSLAEDQKKKTLKLGEGLAGQAAQSGKQLLINDIPEDELTVSYATGRTKPRNVVAVPIFRHSTVVGVLEFGSF